MIRSYICEDFRQDAFSSALQKQKGFTLIELIIVMIIVGILAAIITPKFIDLDKDAKNAVRRAMSGAVRSAWAVAISDRAVKAITDSTITIIHPSVTQLADYVHGGQAEVIGGKAGIVVNIHGDGEL